MLSIGEKNNNNETTTQGQGRSWLEGGKMRVDSFALPMAVSYECDWGKIFLSDFLEKILQKYHVVIFFSRWLVIGDAITLWCLLAPKNNQELRLGLTGKSGVIL